MSDKGEPNEIDKVLNRAKKIFYFGLVFVIVAPLLFTRQNFWSKLDFHETGQIGDTIGGITAPIVNLIGAILVYYALKAQIQANRLIQNQINSQKIEEIHRKKLQYISEKITMVRNDLNEFSFTYTETINSSGQSRKQKFNYQGTDATSEFVETLQYIGEEHEEDTFIGNPKLTELYNLLEIINSLLDNIHNENISPEDKHFFKSLLAYQFNSKVRPPFTANEKNRARNTEPCKKCGKRHSGIPDRIFDLVDIIDIKIKTTANNT